MSEKLENSETEIPKFNPRRFTEEELANEVKDVDEFIDKYIEITGTGSIEPHLYITTLAVKLATIIGGVHPIDVYVALLESRRDIDCKLEGYNVLHRDCVMCLCMLRSIGLFKAEANKEGLIDDYTMFMPVKDHRWKYFNWRMNELSRNVFLDRHARVAIKTAPAPRLNIDL